jgi:putative redox protein
MIEIEINRLQEDFGFEAKDAHGHTVLMDSNPESGGKNFGVRPMQLLLIAFGGCSGIDVVSILKKQRQEIKGFRILVRGEREKDKVPALWSELTIIFELKGNIDLDKAKKACELSVNKYCSVAETLRKAGGDVKWEVRVIA